MHDMPSRRLPLSATVVAELAGDIIAGRLSAGTMLPAEPQLCTRFGISRTVVREAMARLQRMGLVWVRQGSGTVVLDRSCWHDLDPELLRVRASKGFIGDLVPDLLSIRRMVEVEVAGGAALNRGDGDLARMTGLMDAMYATVDSAAEQTDADIAFHDSLIAASGNRLLREMLRPINQLRRIGSVITTSRDPSIIAISIAGHQAIYEAIAAADPTAAREAMATHIAQFERELLAAMTAIGEQQIGAITHGANGNHRQASSESWGRWVR